MANTFAYAQLFQQALDEQVLAESVTGWMDANAGQVIYNGGNTVKIPKMSMDALADYDRADGYSDGAVTLEYETRTLTQDRGRKFLLDSMDVDETNFVATASQVMAQFQRVHVVPEVDAYRISKIATAAITADENVTYGYTPSATDILDKILEAIATAEDNGFMGAKVIHATTAVTSALEKAVGAKNISAVDFVAGGIRTQVPAVNDVPIIKTPANRMYSAIEVKDATSSDSAGGYAKASTGKNINFMLMPQEAPIGVNKQDAPKIIDPAVNQSADAWMVGYRRYHDLWVKDNQVPGIVVNIKDAKSGS